MPTALVTGAGGFIGSHVSGALVDAGWDVRAFVRYTSHDHRGALVHLPADKLAALDVRLGDLRDPGAVERAVEGCDAVLHLGAHIAIPYSYGHVREVVDTNVGGTLNVLEAVRRHGVGRLVHTSTSEVYGTALSEQIAEAHPLQGQSPYSASKIGADKLVESFFRSFELPAVTLRPFNTYGPRQSPRAVIPTILMQALAGDDIHLGSLAPTRDFTYVSDTARAFVLAATAEGVEGEVVHLGTGREISIGDLVALVGKVLGRDLRVTQDEDRLRPSGSEVLRLLSDPSNARRTLAWEPEVDLEAGLAATYEWLAEHAAWFQLAEYAV